MEKRPRSLFAGGTDYTGVGLDVIVDHLKDWRTSTADTIESLHQHLKEVDANQHAFDSPREIGGYIRGFIDLFSRYVSDFDRLIRQLPAGVSASHLETLSQIYESSRHCESQCVRFSERHIDKELGHEETRDTLDHIYAETRDQIIDYQDLSNVRYRLQALVGVEPDREAMTDIDALELKPNFFGVGINLNHIIKRVATSISKRRGR